MEVKLNIASLPEISYQRVARFLFTKLFVNIVSLSMHYLFMGNLISWISGLQKKSASDKGDLFLHSNNRVSL